MPRAGCARTAGAQEVPVAEVRITGCAGGTGAGAARPGRRRAGLADRQPALRAVRHAQPVRRCAMPAAAARPRAPTGRPRPATGPGDPPAAPAATSVRPPAARPLTVTSGVALAARAAWPTCWRPVPGPMRSRCGRMPAAPVPAGCSRPPPRCRRAPRSARPPRCPGRGGLLPAAAARAEERHLGSRGRMRRPRSRGCCRRPSVTWSEVRLTGVSLPAYRQVDPWPDW